MRCMNPNGGGGGREERGEYKKKKKKIQISLNFSRIVSRTCSLFFVISFGDNEDNISILIIDMLEEEKEKRK